MAARHRNDSVGTADDWEKVSDDDGFSVISIPSDSDVEIIEPPQRVNDDRASSNTNPNTNPNPNQIQHHQDQHQDRRQQQQQQQQQQPNVLGSPPTPVAGPSQDYDWGRPPSYHQDDIDISRPRDQSPDIYDADDLYRPTALRESSVATTVTLDGDYLYPLSTETTEGEGPAVYSSPSAQPVEHRSQAPSQPIPIPPTSTLGSPLFINMGSYGAFERRRSRPGATAAINDIGGQNLPSAPSLWTLPAPAPAPGDRSDTHQGPSGSRPAVHESRSGTLTSNTSSASGGQVDPTEDLSRVVDIGRGAVRESVEVEAEAEAEAGTETNIEIEERNNTEVKSLAELLVDVRQSLEKIESTLRRRCDDWGMDRTHISRCSKLVDDINALGPILSHYARHMDSVAAGTVEAADYDISLNSHLFDWARSLCSNVDIVSIELLEGYNHRTGSGMSLTLVYAMEHVMASQAQLEDFLPIIKADYDEFRTRRMRFATPTIPEPGEQRRRQSWRPTEAIPRLRLELYFLKDQMQHTVQLLQSHGPSLPEPHQRQVAEEVGSALELVLGTISMALTNNASEWIESDNAPGGERVHLTYEEFCDLDPVMLRDFGIRMEQIRDMAVGHRLSGTERVIDVLTEQGQLETLRTLSVVLREMMLPRLEGIPVGE